MDDRTLDDIAHDVEDKMLYMCGCRNCIDTVVGIIKGDIKPFKSHCETCQSCVFEENIDGNK